MVMLTSLRRDLQPVKAAKDVAKKATETVKKGAEVVAANGKKALKKGEKVVEAVKEAAAEEDSSDDSDSSSSEDEVSTCSQKFSRRLLNYFRLPCAGTQEGCH